MPPVVSMVPQRHAGDCGVACLAMFLSVSYEEALLAFSEEALTVLRRGVHWPHLVRAGALLGATLKVRRKWDAETDEGIVHVRFRSGAAHVVVLRGGLFFETNFDVWEPDDYWAAFKAKPGSILVLEDTE